MKRPGLVLFAISLIVAAFPSKNVLAADESGDMTGMKIRRHSRGPDEL